MPDLARCLPCPISYNCAESPRHSLFFCLPIFFHKIIESSIALVERYFSLFWKFICFSSKFVDATIWRRVWRPAGVTLQRHPLTASSLPQRCWLKLPSQTFEEQNTLTQPRVCRVIPACKEKKPMHAWMRGKVVSSTTYSNVTLHACIYVTLLMDSIIHQLEREKSKGAHTICMHASTYVRCVHWCGRVVSSTTYSISLTKLHARLCNKFSRGQVTEIGLGRGWLAATT